MEYKVDHKNSGRTLFLPVRSTTISEIMTIGLSPVFALYVEQQEKQFLNFLFSIKPEFLLNT